MTTTPREIIEYYKDLLIYQYVNKDKASQTIEALASQGILPVTSVQTISFSLAPDSGSFILSYDGNSSPSIAYNDSNATIQTKLQSISGLSSVTVVGEISDQLLTVTFTDVIAPALLLVVGSNTLTSSAVDVDITIAETDVTLPLNVLNGYNLVEGSTIARGDQLDILGKYVGALRSAAGFTEFITLSDSEYISLIRMAITKNSSGSSLSEIQDFIFEFFENQIIVYDSKLMFITFVISSDVGSQELVQLFITEGILPVPMGCGFAVVYGPESEYFSFRTYTHEASLGFGFNTYTVYETDWPWLDYSNVIY